MNIKQISTILNHEIADKEYSIKQKAKESGYSEQTIRNITNASYNNVGIETLKGVCKVLGFNLKIEIEKDNDDKQ